MKFQNIPNHPILIDNLIEIVDKQVLSAALFDDKNINISIFSFADLENISEEQYGGEVLFYIISGSCRIKLKDSEVTLTKGQVYKVKPNTLHEIHGKEPFKMLQITIK